MKAVFIRHVKFEGLGTLAWQLVQAGFELQECDAQGIDLQALVNADLVIILGGPISANDIARFPYLEDEIKLIRLRIRERKPTLGICLGAQLIAKAMGANVYSASGKEIGWAQLQLTEAGQGSWLQHITTPVLHWHGEMFDVPDGAQTLASTTLCANQAFAIGSHTLALQFHLEVCEDMLEYWLAGHIHELDTEQISLQSLRNDTQLWGEKSEKQCRQVLNAWLSDAFGDRPHSQ